MSEQKIDFLKLKEVLRRIPNGEFTPKQLGTLWKQYALKYVDCSKEDLTKVFDGGLGL